MTTRKSNKTQGQTAGKDGFGVHNEWGKLREVLVGSNMNDTVPRWSPDWGRYFHKTTLVGGGSSVKEDMQKNAGKIYSDINPVWYEACQRETEGLVKALTDHGVTVHRPRRLTEEERLREPVGHFQQYARDPQLVIGTHIIETNIRMIYRNKEHLGYDKVLQTFVKKHPEYQHVRMPMIAAEPAGNTPEEWDNDPRLMLEGGDTFVMGKDILVGISSLASSPSGVEWLNRYLGAEGFRVHGVPLTDEWLHLDCIFAVVRPGLAIVVKSALRGGMNAFPSFMRDWEFIEATTDEAHKMHTNTLCLEPGVVVMPEDAERLIGEVEKRKATVVPIPFAGTGSIGGGIRCSTHPLWREE